MRSEVQLAATPIGYVRVELGGRQIGVPEHFLNRTEVGAALEEVGREGVPQQVWMDALGVEAGRLGEAAQDEECACARERAALGVEEELGPMPLVEVRPPVCEVAAKRLHCLAADRHDPLLRALADAANEATFKID